MRLHGFEDAEIGGKPTDFCFLRKGSRTFVLLSQKKGKTKEQKHPVHFLCFSSCLQEVPMWGLTFVHLNDDICMGRVALGHLGAFNSNPQVPVPR